MNTSSLLPHPSNDLSRRFLSLALALGTTLCASATTTVSDEVIYEGIGRPYNGLRLFFDANDFAGVRINTGASGWSVSAVQLVLSDDQGGPADPNGIPQVNVFGALSDPFQKPDPAAQIGSSFDFTSTLAPWGSTPLTKVVELRPGASVLLAPETDYWFIVSLVSGSKLVMKSTSDPIGATSEDVIGNSQTAFTDFNVSSGGYQLNILASPVAVPEPASYALCVSLIGFGAVVVSRRRRD